MFWRNFPYDGHLTWHPFSVMEYHNLTTVHHDSYFVVNFHVLERISANWRRINLISVSTKRTSRKRIISVFSIAKLGMFPIVVERVKITGLLPRVLQHWPKCCSLQQCNTTDLRNIWITQLLVTDCYNLLFLEAWCVCMRDISPQII